MSARHRALTRGAPARDEQPSGHSGCPLQPAQPRTAACSGSRFDGHAAAGRRSDPTLAFEVAGLPRATPVDSTFAIELRGDLQVGLAAGVGAARW